MKKLAVIILNWNGRKLLEEYLPAAVKYSISDESDLIVADNGSTDDSCRYIAENYPEVKLIRFDRNYGFAEGYNRAIEQMFREGGYRYTLLLNSDVEVTEGWWEPLVEYMERNDDVGAVQPKIRARRNREYFEYAGAAGGYLDVLWYPYCRGRLFDSLEKDEGQYDGAPADVCWASGAALLVDTELYLRLGGLDPEFFAHQEEIDLCCRMHHAGKRVVALSESHVFHYGGASLAQGNPQKTYLNFRNNLLLMHKNLPRRIGKRKIFLRMLADTLAFFMFILKGDVANAKSVVKAHCDFRKMKKKYDVFPEKDLISTLPGAGRKAVVDYYLFGKRK